MLTKKEAKIVKAFIDSTCDRVILQFVRVKDGVLVATDGTRGVRVPLREKYQDGIYELVTVKDGAKLLFTDGKLDEYPNFDQVCPDFETLKGNGGFVLEGDTISETSALFKIYQRTNRAINAKFIRDLNTGTRKSPVFFDIYTRADERDSFDKNLFLREPDSQIEYILCPLRLNLEPKALHIVTVTASTGDRYPAGAFSSVAKAQAACEHITNADQGASPKLDSVLLDTLMDVTGDQLEF